MTNKNPCSKTRPKDDPYEVWLTPIGEYHILKKYRGPEGEAADPYSRWLTYHPESGDMGDMYAGEIKRHGWRIR